MNNIQQNPNNESRVQRAFNNAAFFWLDRTEFPLADFLQACTTNFLLRPDFTSDDAEFILKWLEKQKRDAKSNLNKTLKQHEKMGVHPKDLDVVKISLKAFMTKPKISFKPSAKSNLAKKTAEPKAKITKKTTKTVAKKPIKAKIVKKAAEKPKATIAKKAVAKKPPVKKIARTVKKSAKKVTLVKKAKTSVKNISLRSLKSKSKKRRLA
jgi:hypothetical protein